ncbi:anaerobic ribonucleoside-triphosphate reductase activating protein [Clostridium sp. YIM B02505]|uniref:Anaerobic ribonucleoside-triphosphate reductase-activating protein n=1 Tax=Clostridium yunnanense TaxID=2800325 RepID=A0ABS1EQM9_9CLOT|nr:anaerobic ribonucleoside-triphosphate reductase activating protein [Clostridium yunnanense]MBK1811654.1 anaerobic ribonucleoside-triphosphate reductase activating protein [Clostridium yunnanense]
MNKEIRLSGLMHESLVNGPGVRRVLFGQGCRHNCEGCFNVETHPMDGGELKDMDELIDEIVKNPILSGVTFSGGDPWEQAEKFAYIAKRVKESVDNPNFNIWCYTGYTYEFILTNKDSRRGWNELLKYIDVLVDGRFEKNKMADTLKFRGSSNQRIIDVKESLKKGEAITLKY